MHVQKVLIQNFTGLQKNIHLVTQSLLHNITTIAFQMVLLHNLAAHNINVTGRVYYLM
jgi:hypothetical protein